MTFAERLRDLRREKELSQQELARELGISYGAIGNYESGKRFPRREVLDDIADYFNVDMNFLLGKTNYRPEYTLEEKWIIDCYRRADVDAREAVKLTLRRFDEKSTASAAG